MFECNLLGFGQLSEHNSKNYGLGMFGLLVTSYNYSIHRLYKAIKIAFGGPTWCDLSNRWGLLKWEDPQKFRRFQHQNVSKVRIMNHPYSDGLQPIMIETGMMYCLTFLLY